MVDVRKLRFMHQYDGRTSTMMQIIGSLIFRNISLFLHIIFVAIFYNGAICGVIAVMVSFTHYARSPRSCIGTFRPHFARIELHVFRGKR